MSGKTSGTRTYGERLNAHLQRYKEEVLGLTESGYWSHQGRQVAHPHILPPARGHLNLLPAYRSEWVAYSRAATPAITHHKYFHHLNSSQAMCFNLFFPFCADEGRHMPRLLTALGLPGGTVRATFEKVFDKAESTNFDFFLEYEDGRKVFFELKLSESGFGTASPRQWEEKYRRKLESFYRVPLSRLVDAQWLEPGRFMRHYQILRNVSYLASHAGSTLFFVFPRANDCLARDAAAIRKIAAGSLGHRVRILHLEDLVQGMLTMTPVLAPQLQEHYEHFRRKYVI
ncbi:PGN_0703 family putative restriction endonuclease [Noviherbaspirillum aridicola]|uniref:TnsA endonuclease-like protein n=1 Tax=Noviherbaspirillum aridicola TaxID=2849687 RepID=A0ABQ4Q1P3_9BURK|nr:hypothetical protein [Noviherbaspirillum aridicola]GIZ51102.1 hypothetical protein NCCP691_11160 [Noviherbaspirillum aridicola]